MGLGSSSIVHLGHTLSGRVVREGIQGGWGRGVGIGLFDG